MSQLFTKRTTAKFAYTFEFEDLIPSGVTMTGVTHSVPDGLVMDDDAVDTGASSSSVLLSGGTHGKTYEVVAIATLSNDEKVPQSFTLNVFDG